MSRGDAAAATWIFRGDESRRRLTWALSLFEVDARRYGGGKKRSEGPDRPPRSWADMEKDRNKSYGGMGRRR